MTGTSRKHNRLTEFTAKESVINELSLYCKNKFGADDLTVPLRQFDDEPQIGFWSEVITESKREGVYATLQKHFPQLQFPLEKRISLTDDYKNATLKGYALHAMESATGLMLIQPNTLKLFLHPTLVGRIPVLVIEERADFVSIVCALSNKNEPRSVPDSMGASMINGINNWTRLRHALQFRTKSEVLRNPSLYKDRIIVLSRIPYSNVSHTKMGLKREEWLDYSLKIRLEHECAHYFTLRHFGIMTSNMHDEILADYLGISSLLGHYRSSWLLKFMGLERYPDFRISGRLSNYKGELPLSNTAFTILQRIIKQASDNIQIFDSEIQKLGLDENRCARLLSLCKAGLIEMAMEDGVDTLFHNYTKITSRLNVM